VNKKKLLQRVIQSQTNVRFADVVSLAEALGFRLSRSRGSHRIYTHDRIPGLLNLQDVGGQAKPYQVRQLLKLVERYSLTLQED